MLNEERTPSYRLVNILYTLPGMMYLNSGLDEKDPPAETGLVHISTQVTKAK